MSGEPEPGTGTALDQSRVYSNKNQYFEGVPPAIWGFHIGGYQVCEKWLKYRRGCSLSYNDLTHYQQTIAALAATIRLMKRIDEMISRWPLE